LASLALLPKTINLHLEVLRVKRLTPQTNDISSVGQSLVFVPMDHSPINQNFELNKSRQKFHHSLKEHHKISNIPKFRFKML
jgi:hypothetical protein